MIFSSKTSIKRNKYSILWNIYPTLTYVNYVQFPISKLLLNECYLKIYFIYFYFYFNPMTKWVTNNQTEL